MDALLGAMGMAALAGVAGVARWGRAVRSGWVSVLVAGLVAGAAIAATAAPLVVATAARRDRFLAAGVVATGFVIAAAMAIALLPALARVLSRRRPAPSRGSAAEALPGAWPSIVVWVPLVVALGAALAFWAVWQDRVPLAGRWLRAALALVIGAALPTAALGRIFETVRVPRPRLAIALTVLGWGVVGGVVVLLTWSDHLRFVSWRHVIALAAIVAVALLVRPLLAGIAAWPARRRMAMVAATAAAAALGVLGAAESEQARKMVSARGALVPPILTAAQTAFDFDRDGYARFLGGGDCDDRDPTVFPGALDFPDDGLDQDCDGEDVTGAIATPGPFGRLPTSIPADLNLLLITIDTIRADHLGCYGYRRPTSPALDALAAEGALFENGWAHAPSTRYSMPALATGRWPSAIAWDESIWWPRIAPSVRTVGEALKGLGYRTASFFSFDYFAPADRRGFERGIDVYRADRAALHRAVNGPVESHGSSAREMADDTIGFIEAHAGQKFFLWAHFYDPHLTYEHHPEVPSFGSRRKDLYDGEIRFTDMHIGRVLARLRELGLWERTAVLVTGDHGEGFGEHGVTEHGFHLYAPQTKVPFIVRVPGLGPRRVRTPAGHVDLAPTMAHLAGSPEEPSFLGRSLVPEIAGTSGGEKTGSAAAKSATDTGAGSDGVAGPGGGGVVFQEVTSERGKKRALVTDRLHVIWNWTPENTTECYDLLADPGETKDLWGRAAGERAGCGPVKRALQRWVSLLGVPADARAKLVDAVFAGERRAPAPQVPFQAAFGGKVELLGFGVTPAGDVDVRPGGEVVLAHHFRSRAPVGDGWKFFFHLTGPGGFFRNLDHVPVGGAMPLERWRPGQVVVDRFPFVVPPGTAPGRYVVRVGIYRGQERLPVTPAGLSGGIDAVTTVALDVR